MATTVATVSRQPQQQPQQQQQMTNRDEISGIMAAVADGNVSKLNPAQKLQYLHAYCKSLGLNPLSNPIQFTKLNGKEIPYATKNATDQLRMIHHVSCEVKEQTIDQDTGLVTVRVCLTTPDGRSDEDVGVVPLPKGNGEAVGNAILKCVSKAKRRATLSMFGLGCIDELEVAAVKAAVTSRIRPGKAPISPAPEVSTEELSAQFKSIAGGDNGVIQ